MQPLAVSANQRYLITADGTPFFYLGDTAWELFHRLHREDADLYLETRASQGFTVIQAAALAEEAGLTVPNAYGELPLHNANPETPNEAYFQHVDYVVDKAESLGMYVGFLPTWGDKWNRKWGKGPEVFTPANAYVYGEFLGKRYKNKPIIWVLGGDRPIENAMHRQIYEAMADGAAAGDGGSHLRTFHPMGGESSSLHLHDDSRLDFNMLQSGHGSRFIPNYEAIAADYARQPIKPCMDAEPNYEDHPINWKPENGYFSDYDVRVSAYRSVFAGAHGVTYGCQAMWQFWTPEREPVAFPKTSWQEALHLPGAEQMIALRQLMEARPYLDRIPDQSLLTWNSDDPAWHQVATRDKAGTYALIYAPRFEKIAFDLSSLRGLEYRAAWYDPRTGNANVMGVFTADRDWEIGSRTAELEEDWVLILDDVRADYPLPIDDEE